MLLAELPARFVEGSRRGTATIERGTLAPALAAAGSEIPKSSDKESEVVGLKRWEQRKGKAVRRREASPFVETNYATEKPLGATARRSVH